MTTQHYEPLHARLLSERERLQREIDSLGEGIKASTFSADEMMDVVDQHPADQSDELFEREKNLTLQRTLEISLQQVHDALARFDDGTYGTCESCGKTIPEKRLEALPEATYCIECQRQVDAQR